MASRPPTRPRQKTSSPGAERQEALKQIKDFLDLYPNEVVAIFIQDATTPKDTAKAFLDAGLGRYLYTHERDNS